MKSGLFCKKTNKATKKNIFSSLVGNQSRYVTALLRKNEGWLQQPLGPHNGVKTFRKLYRGSPVSAIFWSPGNHII